MKAIIPVAIITGGAVASYVYLVVKRYFIKPKKDKKKKEGWNEKSERGLF